MTASSFYVTTAIDYANGAPHLGHAYEKVLTDVIARSKRLRGQSCFYLTGLDEHGQKVQQTAEREGVEPQALCDQVAEAFQAMCQKLELSNDDYIRTTQPRHKTIVQKILKNLHDKGDIYKADYQGYYSTRAEQFLQEKDREEDGSWPSIFGEVTEITETNYFFKLSKYQDWLIEYIESHPDFIFPKYRAKQVLEFLKKEALNDLCISRPKTRLNWGIELPFDSAYVTYVWFDALINYLSAVGYGTDDFECHWPADYHVIGKDILVPAHGVYWPCMLKAMDIAIPKTLLVHGWWMISGSKMSKSEGNIVNPLDVVDHFGVDPFRYFLMREMTVGSDSNFSLDLFQARYNAELANDLGNLVSRVLNMTHRYCDGNVPEIKQVEAQETELQELWAATYPAVLDQFDGLQFHTALETTFNFIKAINRYAENRAPWTLAKSDDPEDQNRLQTSLATMAEGIRLASILLTPVMPAISKQIQTLLGIDPIESWDALAWDKNYLTGKTVTKKAILFPRVELEPAKA